MAEMDKTKLSYRSQQRRFAKSAASQRALGRSIGWKTQIDQVLRLALVKPDAEEIVWYSLDRLRAHSGCTALLVPDLADIRGRNDINNGRASHHAAPVEAAA